MKKAKMMLLAIAIVGIAGSAWAFKVQKGGNFVPFGCKLPDDKCTKALAVIQGKVDPNGPFTTTGSPTSDPNLTCTTDTDCGTITYRTDL